MTLVLLALITALVLAVICRGRPSTFARPPTRRLGMLGLTVVALATAPLAKSPGVEVGWLVVAVFSLVWFGLLNRGRPGIGLMLAGLGVNSIVVMLNGGMPVSLAAVDRAGVPLSRVALDTNVLHEELNDSTILPWLGEAIPLALPIRPAVASAGDVLLAAGVALFIFTGLTGFGRDVPEVLLSPMEKRAIRKKKKYEDRAQAAAQAESGELLADSAMRERFAEETDAETATTPTGTPLVVSGGGEVAPDQPGTDPGQVATPAAAAAGDAEEPAPDPAAIAAAAAAARVEAERRKLQRQIKRMKKQKKQLKRQAVPPTAAVPDGSADDESAPSLVPQSPGGSPVPTRPGLSVVPPVPTDDEDDDEDEDEDEIAMPVPDSLGRRRAGPPIVDSPPTGTDPAITPSNDRLA